MPSIVQTKLTRSSSSERMHTSPPVILEDFPQPNEAAGAGPDNEEWFDLIVQGHAASKLLWTAVEFDLFSLLSARGPLTRTEIAMELGLRDQPARVLLFGLTALRLLRKQDNRYRNTPFAERRLVRDAPESLIPLLGWQHHIVYPGLADLTESLRQDRNVGLCRFPGEGDTLYERLVSDPPKEKVFADAMSCLSRQANRNLAACQAFGKARHLVDCGGGDGSNALRLARAHNELRVTVFDNKSVAARATSHIARAGMAERVRAVPGNFLEDPLPTGTDAILLAHILTIWSPERNLRLLRKCHEHLPLGGRLFIFNMVSRDDDTGPLINALGTAYFQAIASGEGMLYSGKDYEEWLRVAGFSHISQEKLPLEHVLFVVEKTV